MPYSSRKRKKKKEISPRRKLIGKIVLAFICLWLCIGAFFLLKQTLFDEDSTLAAAEADTSSKGIPYLELISSESSMQTAESTQEAASTEETTTEPETTAEPTTAEDLSRYDEMERLAREVIRSSTSDSDSDLYKLYNTYWWIKNRMKYTGTSNKNGWVAEAIHGFETLSGDCYTHFAMMKAVMRVMGFETIDIQRLGGETRHYWNLVKYNGEWYHIDSCPRSVDKDKYWYCFLRTDEELIEWDKQQDEAKGYYNFDSSLYPATATAPLNLGSMQSRK